jgi:hypothetical protein
MRSMPATRYFIRYPETACCKNNAHSVDPDNIARFQVGGQIGIGSHIDELGDVEGNVMQPLAMAHGVTRQLDGFNHR